VRHRGTIPNIIIGIEIMGGMKMLLFKTCLSNATEQALEALIDRSLAEYYFGGSMPYRGSTDADRAQTLLFELWGESRARRRVVVRARTTPRPVCR
jgi:hypothetical protein